MPSWLLYLFRLAFFLPVIIAAAFVSIVWGYFYGDDLGVINYYIRLLGLPGVRWLTDANQAMILDHHHGRLEKYRLLHDRLHCRTPGRAEEYHRGGGHGWNTGWRQFFRITLPYISPVVFFCIVYASIGALQVFESIVILTQGGPGDSTRSLSILIVEEGFGSFQIGYAASISGGHDDHHSHHHRRSSNSSRVDGCSNEQCDADTRRQTLDRLGNHRHDGSARAWHVATVYVAVFDVVPAGE